MIEFPVDLQTFKLYFLREAGLEYQAYPTFIVTVYTAGDKVNHNEKSWVSDTDNNITEPGAEEASWTELGPADKELKEWVAPKAYQTDEKVLAIVNFKPSVWVSLADDNYTTPGTSDDWEMDIDETENLENVILDADIERAMGEAIFKFNPRLFTEEKGKVIFLYLTMFFLVYDRQMAASGMNGNSASGPVIHRTVGKMSVSYMESKLFSKYPSYEFLASNDYGRKAFNLMAPYLRGGITLLHGGATGE